jgi:hypothetical protein
MNIRSNKIRSSAFRKNKNYIKCTLYQLKFDHLISYQIKRAQKKHVEPAPLSEIRVGKRMILYNHSASFV